MQPAPIWRQDISCSLPPPSPGSLFPLPEIVTAILTSITGVCSMVCTLLCLAFYLRILWSQDSCMLLGVSVVCSFFLVLSLSTAWICHYLSILLLTNICVFASLGTILNDSMMNMFVHAFRWKYAPVSFGYWPKRGIAGPQHRQLYI